MKLNALLPVLCLVLILACAAIADTPAYLSNVTWTAVGPGGGGAQYNPAIAPGNPSLMYGFCDMGGVYRSTDGGRNWRMLTADQAQVPNTYDPYPVHCNPAFDPADGNKCFIGIYGGLRVTADGGVTWQWARDGATPTAIAVDSGDTQVVFYADNTDADDSNRMYKSADGGSTWGEVTSWNSSVNVTVTDIFVDASSPSSNLTVYAATQNGLYKSTDGGSTWGAANGDLPSTAISDFNAGMKDGSAVLYAAISGYGVYKSTDGGAHWLAKNTGFNVAAAGHMELGLCDGNPDIVYVGSEEGYTPTIYKTINGGESWQMILTHPNDEARFPAGVTVERSWMWTEHPPFDWGWQGEPHEIGVCATDGNVMAFADDGQTWRTNDGGASWFCCNTHETSNGSDWWASTGFETTTCYFTRFAPWDHNFACTGYADIGCFKSADRGVSWRVATIGSPWTNTYYDVAFDPTIAGKMWAAASNIHDLPHEYAIGRSDLPTFPGGIVKSTNYGANWTDVGHSTGLSVGAPTSIIVDPTSPAGNRTLYATVVGHGVYKSTDDGASWAAANSGLNLTNNMNAWMIKRMPDGTLYVAFTMAKVSGIRYPGGLFKSTNGASTWTRIVLPADIYYVVGFDVDATNQNRIYVSSFQANYVGHGVWVTTDAGAHWSNTLTGGEVSGVSMDPMQPSRVYATPEQGEQFWPLGGIYISEDYGATWTKIPGFPFERFGPNYVTFDPDDSTKIFVTTFGGGVWKATVPRAPGTAPLYQFAASDGETSTTNTNYVGKVSLTIDSGVQDDWMIFGFCEFRCPNVSYATFVQLFIVGAGEGQNTRKPVDPTDYLPFITVKVKNLAPGAHTVQLKYRAGNAAAAAYVRRARICAVRKGALEFWNAANDNAKALTINSTDIAALAWTPALQGNYLVISTAELNATTAVSTDLQTLYNGVVNDEGVMRAADNGDYTTFMSFNYCANAPAGVPIEHKITGRKMATDPINHYIRRARILALRLSGGRFAQTAAGYALEQNTTQTTWQQCLTTTWTYGLSGNWLFLNSARLNNSSTSYQTEVRVQLNNSADCGDQLMRPKATTDLLNFSSIDIRSLAASRTVDMDWRTTNAAGTAKVKRLRFYGLPLDAQ